MKNEEIVMAETLINNSNANENLENNPNKTMIRTIICNQLFSARFDHIEALSLGGVEAIAERMIIDRADIQGIPVHVDYVEYKLEKMKCAIGKLYSYIQNKQCTMVHDDIYNVLTGHVVNKRGFGFVRGNEKGKYNYIWIDLCGFASSGNIDKIVEGMKNNTQKEFITYATFDIKGAHVKNGKGGLLEMLGYDAPKANETTAQEVRQAILNKFQEMFEKYHITTNTAKILDIVYSGGYGSTMITLGFARNVKRIKRVEENWNAMLEINMDMGLEAYKLFRKDVIKKIHGQKIGESRKINNRTKRREIKLLEANRVYLVKCAIRTLSFNGWDNEQLAKKFNLSQRQVGSILAWTTGELKKKDKFVNNHFTINASKKWVENMDKLIGMVDDDIAKVA